MRDDFRLRADFASKEEAEAFADACRELLPQDCETSLADSRVFVYPDTEDDAGRAQEILSRVAVDQGRPFLRVELKRWNPVTAEWQHLHCPSREAPSRSAR